MSISSDRLSSERTAAILRLNGTSPGIGPGPGLGPGADAPVSIALEILLRNGVWIKNRFHFPQASMVGCIIHGHGDEYAIEFTHRCRSRRHLYTELRRLVPFFVYSESMGWFRTMNKELNMTGNCLFEGAKLEINLAPSIVPEFGFCFPRTSFAQERERLDAAGQLFVEPSGDWAGWVRREPADSDRLRVNRNGWEILYFLRPPPTEFDLTFSDLMMELCSTFQIEDRRRVSFSSGPFYWGADFKEDGLGLYTNYFSTDIVVDGRHMVTSNGSALINVIEMPLPPPYQSGISET